VQAQDVLGLCPVHSQAAGQYAGTGIRDPKHFQQALKATVRAIPAAHSQESHVYPRLAQGHVDVTIDKEGMDVMALFA
jgi:hypothetical protein